MIEQSELNSVSLEKASDMISEALINERLALKQKRAELDALKAKYQDDYIVANDGDASENAPLEQAIQNLKITTGDIVSVTNKYQRLDAIEDSKYLNATFDYDIIMQNIGSLSQDSLNVICNVFGVSDYHDIPKAGMAMSYEELSDALLKYDEYYGTSMMESLKVDFPEDDPIWKSRSAIENEVAARRSNGLLSLEYRILTEFEEVKTMKQVPPYNYCGIVVMYSTVRLKLGDRTFTYKIYPKGLSFIDDGVMAVNSRLGAAVMGKKKGDKVSIRHGSHDTVLIYEIVDIY